MKTLLVLLVVLSGAFAYGESPLKRVQKESAVCYGREYSKAHLDKNTKQSVKSMKIKLFDHPENPGQISLDVDVILKKEFKYDDYTYEEFKPYRSGLVCYSTTDKLIKCSIDCDGGSLEITWDAKKNADNSVTLINKGFVVYGGCGEEDENGEPLDSHWLEATKGGDDIFKLYLLPKEFCAI